MKEFILVEKFEEDGNTREVVIPTNQIASIKEVEDKDNFSSRIWLNEYNIAVMGNTFCVKGKPSDIYNKMYDKE